jgi:hypothetical protein
MTTFKTNQRVIIMPTNCNGHLNTAWFQRKEQAREDHLRNCWYEATVRQVFEPDLLTKRPRYLLDNTYYVAIFDEYRLVDYSDIT